MPSLHHPGPLLAGLLLLGSLWTLAQPAWAADIHRSQHHDFRIEVLFEGLEHPWALAFLPDGRLLVTEVARHGDTAESTDRLPVHVRR